MPEERSRPAGPGEAAQVPHHAAATDASADTASDAGPSSKSQPSGKTNPERAEDELERQLDSGEENPT